MVRIVVISEPRNPTPALLCLALLGDFGFLDVRLANLLAASARLRLLQLQLKSGSGLWFFGPLDQDPDFWNIWIQQCRKVFFFVRMCIFCSWNWRSSILRAVPDCELFISVSGFGYLKYMDQHYRDFFFILKWIFYYKLKLSPSKIVMEKIMIIRIPDCVF